MFSMRNLLERRLPQYFAVYLGAGWGLIEFVSFLEDRYAIAPAWTDIALLAWILLVPSVLLFAYHHGRPGADRWVRSEKIGIPANLIVALCVILVAFSGRDLSAAVSRVMVVDEEGRAQERTVARAEFRKRVAFFNFAVPQADTASAWLATGVPSLITTDLAQDLFIDARVPMLFRAQLREAGVPDGGAAPLTLQRRIADDAHLPFFVSGSAERRDGTFTVRATVYRTSNGEPVGELAESGPELLPLVDRLSQGLKDILEVPRVRSDGVLDLPVGEITSSSEEAVRAMLEAQFAASADRWADAERLMLRATELDPSFALAHFGLYQVRTYMGRGQEGLASLASAMQHLYRLPERTQMLVKVEHFVSQREMEKALAVTSMMTEVYPADLQGHLVRAQLLTFTDDKAGAIRSLQAVVQLDPQQHEQLLQIGQLQTDAGALNDALATFQDYARQFPQDATVQLRIGKTLQSLGRLEEARASLERALVLEPSSTEAGVELAMLLRSTGEVEEAGRRLQALLAAARTAEDQGRVQAALVAYYNFRGQLGRAITAGEGRIAAARQMSPPIMVAAQRLGMLGLYVRAGQPARADAILAEVQREMANSVDEFWRIGQLEIALARRDTLLIADARAGVRAIIDQFGFRFLEHTVAHADAVSAEERGDWNEALRHYQKVRELEPTRLDIIRDVARSHRMLNRLADAQAAIDEHLRSVPWSPESNIEAARIRLAQGDAAGARAHLERAAAVLQDADAGYAPAGELRQLMGQ